MGRWGFRIQSHALWRRWSTLCSAALPAVRRGAGGADRAMRELAGPNWRSRASLPARCQRPFGHGKRDGAICAPCLAAPPKHDGIAAGTLYNDASRRLVLAFKHGRRIALAPMLARLIAARLPRSMKRMAGGAGPLHRMRLWSRGFNQAALLARELAKLTGSAPAGRWAGPPEADAGAGRIGAKGRGRGRCRARSLVESGARRADQGRERPAGRRCAHQRRDQQRLRQRAQARRRGESSDRLLRAGARRSAGCNRLIPKRKTPGESSGRPRDDFVRAGSPGACGGTTITRPNSLIFPAGLRPGFAETPISLALESTPPVGGRPFVPLAGSSHRKVA